MLRVASLNSGSPVHIPSKVLDKSDIEKVSHPVEESLNFFVRPEISF